MDTIEKGVQTPLNEWRQKMQELDDQLTEVKNFFGFIFSALTTAVVEFIRFALLMAVLAYAGYLIYLGAVEIVKFIPPLF
jgi:hypothetical protein